MAWAMIIGALTNFTKPDASALAATAVAALVFITLQIFLQSFWTLLGAGVARLIGGTTSEVWLMRFLAVLMVGSVLYAILRGG